MLITTVNELEIARSALFISFVSCGLQLKARFLSPLSSIGDLSCCCRSRSDAEPVNFSH